MLFSTERRNFVELKWEIDHRMSKQIFLLPPENAEKKEK
jgi:hypothetical protein